MRKFQTVANQNKLFIPAARGRMAQVLHLAKWEKKMMLWQGDRANTNTGRACNKP